jgi:predicted DNA-binding antitoxin AbrB/MazE fold protein
MATAVNNKETVVLKDGSKVEITPLSIRNLRKFMEIVKGFEKTKNELDALDLMIEAVQVALCAVDAEKYADVDHLNDVLDMPTIAQIMRVAGGVDIEEDPNLAAATA